MKSLICALLCCSGCASALAISETALPRLGHGLQATTALYDAACYPKPLPSLEELCPVVKTGINEAVDGYTEINNAVKAAQ